MLASSSKVSSQIFKGFAQNNKNTLISNSFKAAQIHIGNNKMVEDKSVLKHYEFNKRMEPVGDKNIWVEYTGLAREYNAVNLGQGFPDYQSATYLNQKVKETLEESNDLIYQYTRSPGHLPLVNAIGKVYSKFMGREIDPLTEVLVTVGAYGSLFNAMTAFLEKGDEVIIIEPFYDCYAPIAAISSGTAKYVTLKPTVKPTDRPMTSGDFGWDINELEAAFTSKTKAIVINNPNNPLGKVYSREELQKIADLCIKHNVLCLADEVYEHLAVDGEHIRMATLPGMWERTVTFGSAGKTFSTTGSKIGWTIGPKELVRLCVSTHNNSIYVCPTFMQDVIARCFEFELTRLDSPECYFNSIKEELRPKRDALAKKLIEAGLEPIIPEGGYFMMADISKIAGKFSTDDKEIKDSKFVKYLIREKNLATIPSSAFYSDDHKLVGENYIRFCFFKNETTLEKCADILKNLNVE